jgi:hypothetical protein
MKMLEGGAYDPETVALLGTPLDEAWANLLPEQQAATDKRVLAKRILKLAAQGERDPVRLRTGALVEVVPAV